MIIRIFTVSVFIGFVVTQNNKENAICLFLIDVETRSWKSRCPQIIKNVLRERTLLICEGVQESRLDPFANPASNDNLKINLFTFLM